jgi:ribose/xylose/arabinose/galactoside ABC-type transport system permease subunit
VALFSCVNVRTETCAVYVISSIAAGFAGMALAGYVGDLGMGDPNLFTSIAAVAIAAGSLGPRAGGRAAPKWLFVAWSAGGSRSRPRRAHRHRAGSGSRGSTTDCR